MKSNNLEYKLPTIGKVGPGIYCIGNGWYTGEKGWEAFLKVLRAELDKFKSDKTNDAIEL